MGLVEEGGEPAGIGSGAGGREAEMLRMEGQATDGIDGRLAENEGGLIAGRNGEDQGSDRQDERHAGFTW